MSALGVAPVALGAGSVPPLVDPAAVAPPLQSDWAFVARNAPYLFEGTVLTIGLTVLSVLLGFGLGFPAGAVEVYGGPLLRSLVETVGVVFRGTPIVVILIFLYFVFPAPDLDLGVVTLSGAFVAGTLGLGLRSAAYQSQIFRGAIQSVAEGQMEAARSIGMSKLAAIRHVIVPQALRRSVPGFQNEVTIVLKDTSVVFAIGLAELLTRSHDLFVRQTTAILEVILFASAIYFVLTMVVNRGLEVVERRYRIPEGNA